jgi:hypothetical protein
VQLVWGRTEQSGAEKLGGVDWVGPEGGWSKPSDGNLSSPILLFFNEALKSH